MTTSTITSAVFLAEATVLLFVSSDFVFRGRLREVGYVQTVYNFALLLRDYPLNYLCTIVGDVTPHTKRLVVDDIP